MNQLLPMTDEYQQAEQELAAQAFDEHIDDLKREANELAKDMFFITKLLSEERFEDAVIYLRQLIQRDTTALLDSVEKLS